ncbi:calcium-binding protein, partial [Sphingomonas naasensis]
MNSKMEELGPQYRWRFVGVSPFEARDGHGLISYHGKLWSYGGWNPLDSENFPQITNNEIWVSTDPGANVWQLATPHAEWDPRHTFGTVIHDDHVIIIGGDVIQGKYQSDVWSSDDGYTFTLLNGDAPWGPRTLFLSASFQGQIWVFGGQTLSEFAGGGPDIAYRDAWKSADGITWTQAATDLPFLPRGLVDNLVELDGYLWAIGGGMYATAGSPFEHRNDVWRSADGINWELVLDHAPWEARRYGSVEVYDGRLWVVGGVNENGNIADSWMSEDGINWISVPAPFSPRHAAGLAVHDGQMYLTSADLAANDIWVLREAVVVYGTPDSDTLTGHGEEILVGGAGDDQYVLSTDDEVYETINSGRDTIYTRGNFLLTDDVYVEVLSAADSTMVDPLELEGNVHDNLIIGAAGDDFLLGNGGADILRGGAGADRLFGGADDDELDGEGGDDRLDGGEGVDVLSGGDGHDWYYVDNPGDAVVEMAGQGWDRVYASASYTLTAGAEVEELHTADFLGTAGIDLTGNGVGQYLLGNAGANRLDGGGGTDTLAGGAGDDIYVADSDDTIVELEGEGADTILARTSFALAGGVHIERLAAADPLSTDALDLTGNELDNSISGSAGANRLDGGGGTDTLAGGAGDDIYVVDSDDTIVELEGEGEDTILARTSLALAGGVHIERLAAADPLSTDALDLTGNELDNSISGNAGANRLDGGRGADALAGGAGDDVLIGGEGDDTIDGGLGADVLEGGVGDDAYYVDGDDTVVELEGEGEDTILARTSFVLAAGAHVERLVAADPRSTDALDLTGNELDNSISGGAGANRLDGGGGADTMTGFDGHDWYYVDNAGDVVVEAVGQGW